MDAWPDDLPQAFQLDQFSESEGNGLVEYAPEYGPSITRLATTAVMRPLSGWMICSGAQRSSFRTFFRTTILQGSLPFIMPAPGGGDPLTVKFTQATPPTWNYLGGDNWQLNMSLVELP
jgi:hypothetical protein